MSAHDIDLERFGMRMVPIEGLATSFAHVRGSERRPAPQVLAPAPIRVLADPEHPGRYEVVDGFRRLAAFREEGLSEIIVIVEPAAESIPLAQQALALILRANSPARTVGVMDEVRVVKCLVDAEHLSPGAAGRVLGQGKPWISKRLTLAHKLATEVAREVAAGSLSLGVAYALCALPRGDQVRLARQVVALDLPAGHVNLLVQAYRVAATAAEKQAILSDPRGFLAEIHDGAGKGSERDGNIIGLSPCVRERIGFYNRLSKHLHELEHEAPLIGLNANEARLLAAERQRLDAQIAAHVRHHSQRASGCG